MTESPTAPRPGASRDKRRLGRLLKIVVAANLAALVWAVGFRSESPPLAVLPDPVAELSEASDAPSSEFSLDLRVVGETDHELVWAVEQRARPAYRIFSFAPATGEVETVFTVPDDAIIFGIAADPSRQVLAVSYSPDFALGGSGIWILDLSTRELDELVPIEENVYLTDVAWSPDGAKLLATRVDRSGGDEILDAVILDADTGLVEESIADAINPVQISGGTFFLTVDEDQARRSLGSISAAGVTSIIDIENATLDLDHLTADERTGTVRVAALEPVPEPGLTIGSAADAHGSHDLPSTWLTITADRESRPVAGSAEAIIVYDAAATAAGTVVEATAEGLAITRDDRMALIMSRAIRFVTG